MSHGSVVFKAIYTGTGDGLDVLRGQPIKLAQVASTCLKINETSFFSLKLGLFISAGPQKYKHQISQRHFLNHLLKIDFYGKYNFEN